MKHPNAVGRFTLALLLVVTLILGGCGQNSELPLEIYWIDVEGGSSTLIVTPTREAVLMDAGWNREDARDALRIQAAMQDAGITEIDYFIASHFHGDHVGGTPAIASRVLVRQFFDHGDSVEQETEQGRPAWEAYLRAAQGRRQTVRPGDTLPLTGNVELSFVAANREVIGPPGAGTNRHCGPPMASEDLGENSRSVGYMVSLGDFEFLDLGDMTVDVQQSAACPENRLGVVDLYQVPHHGGGGAARPELTWALQPTVAVSNNGPRKGGSPESYAVVRDTPGIEDIWQVHRALGADAAGNTDPRLIANLTEEDDCVGHWIKATVQPDGRSWTMTNGRTGYSRNYLSK
jgi:beta-lactamase superfamily II metal-dependent hydrolase